MIAESKVQGTRDDVSFYPDSHPSAKGIFDFDAHDGMYLSFIDNLPIIAKQGILPAKPSSLVVQMVSNYFYPDQAARSGAEKEVSDRVLSLLKDGPLAGARIDVMLQSTLDVLCDVQDQVGKATQGKRYGNPVLDIARELNRYMGMRAARKRVSDLRKVSFTKFAGSLGCEGLLNSELHSIAGNR